MKLEKLPGGVVYDLDETRRLSKPDAVVLEAIHRQFGVGEQGPPGEPGPPGERGLPGPQGQPGAPGAVATPDTLVIVGPGRPDQATTTGGIIKGSERVGATYYSSDGAGVGAWAWRKRATGWVVVDGDTGWRAISVSFISTGSLYLRRIDGLCYVACGGGTLGAATFSGLTVGGNTGGMANAIPAGWRSTTHVAAPLTDDGKVPAGYIALTSVSDASVIQVRGATASSITSGRVAVTPWAPSDPWPTTLPGSAV